MSETKFTPGPWEAGGTLIGVGKITIRQHLDGSRKADELEANARLISAAPDMYEALKHALSDMDKIDELCKIAGVHKFTMMRREIQSALAKARGEK